LPHIRFSDQPRGLWEHLLERVQEREISLADLGRLQQWVKSNPNAPDGTWYKFEKGVVAAKSAEKRTNAGPV
jgi:hypothetical protein